MKTIFERVNELRGESLYKRAAMEFEVSYKYVWLIAHGRRKANRGKGREIKEWLEQQLKK